MWDELPLSQTKTWLPKKKRDRDSLNDFFLGAIDIKIGSGHCITEPFWCVVFVTHFDRTFDDWKAR